MTEHRFFASCMKRVWWRVSIARWSGDQCVEGVGEVSLSVGKKCNLKGMGDQGEIGRAEISSRWETPSNVKIGLFQHVLHVNVAGGMLMAACHAGGIAVSDHLLPSYRIRPAL